LFDTFTRGQLLSLPMIIFGIVLIYLSLKKNNETVS
jgi:prolipoprotein diacylglyceryltransferase